MRFADIEKFAIPAFNYSDVWDAIAIAEAANEENAIVMLASVPPVVDLIGLDMCDAIGKTLSNRMNTPVIHHLDHSYMLELCKDAVDIGYPSIMFDGSNKTFEQNTKMTKEIVAYAHVHSVHVEGELGKIKGNGVEGTFNGGKFLTEVDEAVEFVQSTGVDSLAIGIGTAHGFYYGEPEINFQRLVEINEAIATPLVLHGGTGLSEEGVKKAIAYGINKVNIGTAINTTYMNSVRIKLVESGENTLSFGVYKVVVPKIKNLVKKWIKICGADNRV